ncbi:MAG TPA: alpha/beta hydrolase [Bryobacteraceae bacterium]|nr:alpha/beta hydrolase [Bryobacteraceae bacterium]
MPGSGHPATDASDRLLHVLRVFRETHAQKVLQVGNDAWEFIVGGGGGHSIFVVGGAGSSAESMFSVNAALESSAQVISFTIPTTASTIELVIEGIRAIMDSLQLRQAIFLGHSLGGMVIQAFAACHSERVAGLVLSNTGFYLGARANWLPAFVRLMARAPESLLLRAVNSQMSRLVKSTPAADFWRRFYQDELNQPGAGARLKHQTNLMLDAFRFFRVHPLSPSLPWARSTPVQVISSADDRGFTKREIDFLAGLYQRSEATRFPKITGHLSFLTRQDEYIGAVQRLIARTPTEAAA